MPPSVRKGVLTNRVKDVAAMANTRSGLIIFGVRDATCGLVGIDLGEVNTDQYAQWARNHVHPYLSGLIFHPSETPTDGTTSVLVADDPVSPMAPYLVLASSTACVLGCDVVLIVDPLRVVLRSPFRGTREGR
ncbi:ATP-binding protein [Streptomyces sp. NPDC002688]|uniref:AlbA family DNA-binding domain-containing protein n=1 Tax=Streptomyces sp. NPDC002688 TaxID=3154423 RepID=UPI0033209A0F